MTGSAEHSVLSAAQAQPYPSAQGHSVSWAPSKQELPAQPPFISARRVLSPGRLKNTFQPQDTESQDVRGWKGPLWVIWSNSLPKQGHTEQAAEDLVQAGLEYLQRRRLHNLPGQPVPVLHHPQSDPLCSTCFAVPEGLQEGSDSTSPLINSCPSSRAGQHHVGLIPPY